MSSEKQRLFEGEDSDINMNNQYSNDDDDDDDDDEEIYQKDAQNDELFVLKAKPKVSSLRNFTDCSNVFKAFIGSAMIGLPFAVLQAGIVLAVVCIFLIAMATDHCCNLIVKCKAYVIENMMRERLANGATKEEIRKEEDLLGRTLSFGRIGKACLGRPGLLAVNISIMVTQFGFATGYFIFLGNTLRTIIKYFVTSDMHNLTVAINMSSINTTTLPTHHPTTYFQTTKLFNNTVLNSSLYVQPMLMSLLDESNHTFIQHILHHVHQVVKEPLSAHNIITNSYTTFGLLITIPLLILIPISFIRNLRKLAPASVVANAAITGAFAFTAVYVAIDIKKLPSPLILYQKKTFAIFFGQVTGAFEGIGTVIPIEGSMAENRHRYPCFLHISLFAVSLILGTFGIIGYLRYGNETCQIFTSSLKGPFGVTLQALLFVGVLFTFPLQIYPCILITERLFIKIKQWYYVRRTKSQGREDEVENLMGNEKKTMDIKNIKLSKWEGNIIRTLLVILTAGIALFFRSQFAYIAAMTGSIGSSLLSYILPPIFHISLRKHKMKRWVLVKDVFLILFGIVGGCMGCIVTIQEMVESFSVGHKKHC